MAYRRRREPAALTSFYLAFVLAALGYPGFEVIVLHKALLEDLTLRENLTIVGIMLVLWLILWPLIASRRRSDRDREA
jgi:hypothetical protein